MTYKLYSQPYHYDGFKELFTEISLRLGNEILTDEGDVNGSFLNDRIVARDGVTSVSAGLGNDVIVTSGAGGTVYDGGGGADTYVLGAGRTTSSVPDCLIFDIGGGGISTGAADRILLSGFSADSTVIDLGEGRVEIIDGDENLIFDVLRADGSAVSFETIVDSFVFAERGEVTEVGGQGGRPLLIVAEDVEGEALGGDARSGTYVVDHTVNSIDARGGDDVILSDLFLMTVEDVFSINGGRGNDLIEVRLNADAQANVTVSGGRGRDTVVIDHRGADGDTVTILDGRGADTYVLRYDAQTTDIEDCLIFDISDGGVSERPTRQRDEVLLPDFNKATTEVVDLGDGIYQFTDLSTGIEAQIGHAYTNGDALTMEDIITLYGEGWNFGEVADAAFL